jgi:hypothetical protein
MYNFDISRYPFIKCESDEFSVELEVTHFKVVEGSYSFNAASDFEYYGCEELNLVGGDELTVEQYQVLHDELLVELSEHFKGEH